MTHKRNLVWMAGAIALAASAAAVQAAPATGLANPQLGAASPSAAESVARRCIWVDGERICRWYRAPRYREYGYPDNYRTGSKRWWEEMDRDDRGGRGRR